jgi:hypothetical protein
MTKTGGDADQAQQDMDFEQCHGDISPHLDPAVIPA